jgi:hypothetical protein
MGLFGRLVGTIKIICFGTNFIMVIIINAIFTLIRHLSPDFEPILTTTWSMLLQFHAASLKI